MVTGSTGGIGYAAARLLATEGASVVVNGRTRERVVDAVRHIRESVAVAEVRGVAADLSTLAGCDTLAEAAGETDVFVNNVGIFQPLPFDDIPDGDWMRFFETNVLSGVRLSRAVLPGMRARDWGRIVFVSNEWPRRSPRR